MVKKRINAGLKSREDFISRAVKGEVFYSLGGKKLWYREEHAFGRNSPFRADSDAMQGLWEEWMHFDIEVEPKWEDGLATGNILCYLSDGNSNPSPVCCATIQWVASYHEGTTWPYRVRAGGTYRHATPVKPSECYHEDNDHGDSSS